MSDPGAEMCAAIADARQTADAGRRNRAFAFLAAHVERSTEWLGRNVSDPADLHDAAVDSLLAAIKKYDCSRGKAFAALYCKILNNRLIAHTRWKMREVRGGGKVVNLSDRNASTHLSIRLCAEERQMTDSVDNRLDARDIFARISEQLTPYQTRVFDLYLRGWTYHQIARLTNCEFEQSAKPKRIDNMLTKIKSMLPKLINHGAIT